MGARHKIHFCHIILYLYKLMCRIQPYLYISDYAFDLEKNPAPYSFMKQNSVSKG